jgi:uncharacterized protein
MTHPPSPFDRARWLGALLEVTPTYARFALREGTGASPGAHYGAPLSAGIVGDFVVVEGVSEAILGRVTETRLPDRNRPDFEPGGQPAEARPIGKLEFLSSFDLETGRPRQGIHHYPAVGAGVFLAHTQLIEWLLIQHRGKAEQPPPVVLDLAVFEQSGRSRIQLLPEEIFGRHCAVLGATGGGKSWTLARLLEQCAQHRSKVILIDATGEFEPLGELADHYSFNKTRGNETLTRLAYTELTEADLFALFTPSGQVQAPRLRSALRSLKLAALKTGVESSDGLIRKANRLKSEVDEPSMKHATEIERAGAAFDILLLPQQIENECVFPSTQGGDGTRWGGPYATDFANCTTLILRIENCIRAPEFAFLFDAETSETTSVHSVIDAFLANESPSLLRLSLRDVAFQFNAREVLVNSLGRMLLDRARRGDFQERPTVLFVDEAHHFLGRSIGGDLPEHRFTLDACELIAKEGRKYGLTLCLATQRPRDLPAAVLSQIGTLIVHRLSHSADREVVEAACSDVTRGGTAFLPSLTPGEALLVGVDLPIPLTLRIQEPSEEHQPKSRGPDYQRYWAAAGSEE